MTMVSRASVGRLVALDSLRGLMLVIMALDHYGGAIKTFTYEPFGFASAAEGFVFISALLLGNVYVGRYARDPVTVRTRLWRRTAKIYRYQVATLLLVLAVALVVPWYARSPFWQEHLHGFFAHPVAAGVGAVTLLYRPYYFDVLPLYIAFIALAPITLHCIARGWTRPLLVGSAVLYVAAQVAAWRGVFVDGLLGQQLDLGSLDVLAWQLLFTVGVVLGGRYAAGGLAVVRSRRYLPHALVLLTGATVLRHLWDPSDGHWAVLDPFISKLALGPLRLASFLLLAFVVAVLVHQRPSWADVRWLRFLGAHSIQVFSVHVVALYLLEPVRGRINVEVEGLLFLLLLTGVAWGHRLWLRLAPAPAPARRRHA